MLSSRCPTCGRGVDKSNTQRNQFHRLCGLIGDHVGLTAGKVKETIKQEFFGLDEWRLNGKWYRGVRPSESAEMDEYSKLIEYTYQYAAENCDLVLDAE